MKRRMRVGEEIDMGQNHMQLVYRGDCRPGRRSRLGYKAVLEARIRDAAKNVEAFRRTEPAPDAATLMVRSTFACMGCHQE